MIAFYNDLDPYCCAWLRNLIDAGEIMPGVVDNRSITEIDPDELKAYTQVHLFAGLGGWALAARRAGWPDDRPLWTGSCPCQPFSVAGLQLGQRDERHLWPDVQRLIAGNWPAIFVGEQVAAAIGKDWIDGVFADLEGLGYACRAVVIPACAVNAPHRRDRAWFIGGLGILDYGNHARLERLGGDDGAARGRQESDRSIAATCRGSVMGDSGSTVCERGTGSILATQTRIGDSDRYFAGDMSVGSQHASESVGVVPNADATRSLPGAHSGLHCEQESSRSRDVESFGPGASWDTGAWLIGHDGKARRVEPNIRMLDYGVSARVGKLRAYGNAIVPQIATEILAAWLDVHPDY